MLAMLVSVFPWNSQTESAMSHRHLMLGYAFAWTVQAIYLASILWKRKNLRKAEAREARHRLR